MRQYLFLILLFLLFNLLTVQAQIVSFSEEAGTLEQQQLVDAKNCFFKNQESVSHIWKLNLVDFLNTEVNFTEPFIGVETGLGIAYEQRLKTGWSLNFSLDGSLLKGGLNQKHVNFYNAFLDANFTILGMAFSVEPRWYFNKKKQIAKGLSGDNLSGMYFGLQLGMDIEKSNAMYIFADNHTISGLENLTETDVLVQNTLFLQTLNFGLQQQFGKSGFFDIKIGAGLKRNRETINSLFLENPNTSEVTWKRILNYQLALGFAVGDNERKTERSNCNVFEYHKNEKRLLKLGIINPSNLFNADGIETILTAGFEQKIGISPVSINANVVFNATPGLIRRFSVELSPRYYYDLRKRQLAGKTGNSFSANYVGLRSELVFGRTISIAPVWGLQRQFFKRFLFDFSAGAERIHSLPNSFPRIRGWNFFSELRIGIAF